MVGKGRRRRGNGQGDNQLPPAFDQQAFMEAIGVAAAIIAHASATARVTSRDQSTSSSNL